MVKAAVRVTARVTRAGISGSTETRALRGPIEGEVKRGAGSLLPWRIADRAYVLAKEAPRLLRVMRRERKSAYLRGGGYPVPLTEGGTPRLWGRLRRSAWARSTGKTIRYGWRAKHATQLERGWWLGRGVRFAIPGRRDRVYLPRGHRVQARRFAEFSVRRWYTEMEARLRRHIASGRPWRRY